MPTENKYQEYLQSVLAALMTPDKLEKHEVRLGTKYQESMGRFEQLRRDMEQIHGQIRQAEAQLRSLELQAADAQGKASGFLELLFGEKFPESEPPQVVTTPAVSEPVPKTAD